MERQSERTDFAKACAYLNYSPRAKWTAHVAAVGSCLFYVALLTVLWLFADLMVSRGRLPTYHDLPYGDQVRFRNEWAALPPPDDDARQPALAFVAGEAALPAEPSGLAPLAVLATAARVTGPADKASSNERTARLELLGLSEDAVWNWRPYPSPR